MVADEVSLFESAGRLPIELAIVDLSLARGEGPGLVRRLRLRFPMLKLIMLSVHDEWSVSQAVIEARAKLRPQAGRGDRAAARRRRRACRALLHFTHLTH